MEIIIDTSTEKVTDWSSKGAARIVQNVVNLLNTLRYEVAYDRTLGLTGSFIDKPADQAVALATAEIYELISEKEPRATLIEVLCVGTDAIGNMQFKVVIELE